MLGIFRGVPTALRPRPYRGDRVKALFDTFPATKPSYHHMCSRLPRGCRQTRRRMSPRPYILFTVTRVRQKSYTRVPWTGGVSFRRYWSFCCFLLQQCSVHRPCLTQNARYTITNPIQYINVPTLRASLPVHTTRALGIILVPTISTGLNIVLSNRNHTQTSATPTHQTYPVRVLIK